jgi:hypothetical protein
MPVILMTAFPLLPHGHPELTTRFTHVLTKPPNLQDFWQAVESARAGGGSP